MFGVCYSKELKYARNLKDKSENNGYCGLRRNTTIDYILIDFYMFLNAVEFMNGITWAIV